MKLLIYGLMAGLMLASVPAKAETVQNRFYSAEELAHMLDSKAMMQQDSEATYGQSCYRLQTVKVVTDEHYQKDVLARMESHSADFDTSAPAPDVFRQVGEMPKVCQN